MVTQEEQDRTNSHREKIVIGWCAFVTTMCLIHSFTGDIVTMNILGVVVTWACGLYAIVTALGSFGVRGTVISLVARDDFVGITHIVKFAKNVPIIWPSISIFLIWYMSHLVDDNQLFYIPIVTLVVHGLSVGFMRYKLYKTLKFVNNLSEAEVKLIKMLHKLENDLE